MKYNLILVDFACRVHGSTVIENLQREVDRSTQEVLNLDRVMQEHDAESEDMHEEGGNVDYDSDNISANNDDTVHAQDNSEARMDVIDEISDGESLSSEVDTNSDTSDDDPITNANNNNGDESGASIDIDAVSSTNDIDGKVETSVEHNGAVEEEVDQESLSNLAQLQKSGSSSDEDKEDSEAGENSEDSKVLESRPIEPDGDNINAMTAETDIVGKGEFGDRVDNSEKQGGGLDDRISTSASIDGTTCAEGSLDCLNVSHSSDLESNKEKSIKDENHEDNTELRSDNSDNQFISTKDDVKINSNSDDECDKEADDLVVDNTADPDTGDDNGYQIGIDGNHTHTTKDDEVASTNTITTPTRESDLENIVSGEMNESDEGLAVNVVVDGSMNDIDPDHNNTYSDEHIVNDGVGSVLNDITELNSTTVIAELVANRSTEDEESIIVGVSNDDENSKSDVSAAIANEKGNDTDVVDKKLDVNGDKASDNAIASETKVDYGSSIVVDAGESNEKSIPVVGVEVNAVVSDDANDSDEDRIEPTVSIETESASSQIVHEEAMGDITRSIALNVDKLVEGEEIHDNNLRDDSNNCDAVSNHEDDKIESDVPPLSDVSSNGGTETSGERLAVEDDVERTVESSKDAVCEYNCTVNGTFSATTINHNESVGEDDNDTSADIEPPDSPPPTSQPIFSVAKEFLKIESSSKPKDKISSNDLTNVTNSTHNATNSSLDSIGVEHSQHVDAKDLNATDLDEIGRTNNSTVNNARSGSILDTSKNSTVSDNVSPSVDTDGDRNQSNSVEDERKLNPSTSSMATANISGANDLNLNISVSQGNSSDERINNANNSDSVSVCESEEVVESRNTNDIDGVVSPTIGDVVNNSIPSTTVIANDTAVMPRQHMNSSIDSPINVTSAVSNASIPISNATVNSSGTTSSVTAKLRSTAACLDALKFSEFQAKMKAKLYSAGGSSGSANSVPLAGGIPPIGNSPDVFRSLMQKIISLEQNSRIFELYTVQINECYQTFFREMEAENQRNEKLLHQKEIQDEENAIQQEMKMLSSIHDVLMREFGDRIITIPHEHLNANNEFVECDVTTDDCAPLTGESAVILENRLHSGVNVDVWLKNVDHSGLLTRFLNIVLPLCFGADYIRSNVPLVDLVLYSIGLCFAVFSMLLLLIIALAAYVTYLLCA